MPFDLEKDYLSIHGDFAPDPDEFHATAAHYTLAKEFGVQNYGFVVGSYGLNADIVHVNLPQFKQEFFVDGGIPFVDADADYVANGNFAQSGIELGQKWLPSLQAGGDVYVAEGGQSDITLEAVKYIQTQGFSASRVTVVQHSTWNINNTSPGVIDELQARGANWIRIEDGNHPNSTPDWNDGSANAAFRAAALSGPYAREWKAGFDAMPNQNRLDFSDAVETAHILGMPTSQAPSVISFADQFFTPNPVMPTLSVTSYNPSVEEGNSYQFGVVASSSPTQNVTITYRITGTRGAVAGVDFEPGQGSQDALIPELNAYEGTATLVEGQGFVGFPYEILSDLESDSGERIRFELLTATNATIDPANDTTFLDLYDPTPTVSVGEYNPTANEGSTFGFGVVSDTVPSGDILISYRVTGTRGAQPGLDFAPGQGRSDALINPSSYEGTTTLVQGQSFGSVSYDILPDAVFDPGERVRFEILGATGANIDANNDTTFLDLIDVPPAI